VIHLYRRRLAVCVLSSVCGRPGRHITFVIASRQPSPSPAWARVSAAARHGLSCALWLVHPPLKARESHVVVAFLVFPRLSSFQEPRLLFFAQQSLGGWVSHVVYTMTFHHNHITRYTHFLNQNLVSCIKSTEENLTRIEKFVTIK